jgi:hypothetical protein
VKDFHDKERFAEAFPPIVCPGLPFDKLTAEERPLVENALRSMTSGYGASRCLAVARQTGPARIYLNYVGVPAAEQPFAWRIATHHLTLIYADFGKGKAGDFGPILLGGNPANDLWDAEEKLALELFASLSPAERNLVKWKGGSASRAAVGKSGGAIGELAEKPQRLARQLLGQRLAVLSADRRNAFEEMVQRQGGIDKLAQVLKEQLSGVKVYKVGDEAEKQVVVGKTSDGQWAGLKTTVVET